MLSQAEDQEYRENNGDLFYGNLGKHLIRILEMIPGILGKFPVEIPLVSFRAICEVTNGILEDIPEEPVIEIPGKFLETSRMLSRMNSVWNSRINTTDFSRGLLQIFCYNL